VESNLSPREREFMCGVRDGLRYVEIASRMQLSLETIKTYSARTRAKLRIANKAGLAAWAREHLKGTA
jgi:DNA-binding CsgD family transcriptional regulator